MATASLRRGLSLLGVIALVAGNMMGTSLYTLPASLADVAGPLGLVAWVVTAAGYFCVAEVYASLGSRFPLSGGPYVFARRAFGEFAGFQSVWAYWLSAVIGNAGIVTGIVAYAGGLWPALGASALVQFAAAQVLLWGLCFVNVLGVRHGARLQIVVVLLALVPLVGIGILALGHFDSANLRPFAPNGLTSLATGAALVVWAYSGVESATVPAEEVNVPGRDIRLGTRIGYAVATAVFLLTAVAATGALPRETIASTPRPLALVALETAGPSAAAALSAAAIVAGMGTLNGWILMTGRIPLTAAREGLFFQRLALIHPRFGTPHVALITGTAVGSAMCTLYFEHSLLRAFNFIVLLAVLTTLLPHLYAAAAEWWLARSTGSGMTPRQRRRSLILAPLAFVFLLYTIYGVGPEVALWGLLATLAGIPLYIAFTTQDPSRTARVDG